MGDRDRKRKGKMPAYEDDPNPYKRARLFARGRGGGDGSSSSAGASGAWRIPRAGAGNPGQDAPGSASVVNLPHGHQQPGGSSFRDGHGIQLQAPASENLPPTAPRQVPPPQLAVQPLLQQYQAMQATNPRPMGHQHGGALGVGGSSFSFNHGHGLQSQAPASENLPLQLQLQPRGDACVCLLCQNSRCFPCGRCLLERDPRQLTPHQLAVLQLQSRGSLQQAPQYQQIQENSRQLVILLRRQAHVDLLYRVRRNQQHVREVVRQQLQNWRPVQQQPPQAPIPEVGTCPICDCEGEGRVSYHPWRHVCPCDICNFAAYRCEVCQPEQAAVPATSGPPPPPPQPRHQHPPRSQQHPQPPPPVGAGAQQLQNQPEMGQLGEVPGGYAAQVGHPVPPAEQLVHGPGPNDESAPCWGCGLSLAPVNPQPSRHVCLCYACRYVYRITCSTCAGYII